MPSPAESEYREVLYCGQSASIPGTLLYMSGELAYVRFRTSDWPGYNGYCNFVTAAVFAEHLRPEGIDVPYVTSGPRGPDAIGQEEVPRSSSQPPPESKPQAPPPAAAKPVQRDKSSAVGNLTEPSKAKLNGKEGYAGVRFPTRSLERTRSIGGFSLRDFLGNR
jgi:hypothetical protein